MPRQDLIQFRGGTTAAWNSANPVLALNEPGLDVTTGVIKFGDGTNTWSNLPTNQATIAQVSSMLLAYYTKVDADTLLNQKASTSALSTAIATRAPTVHQHATSDIMDLAEFTQDTTAGLLKGGSGVVLTYDDAANTLTISATASGGTTDPEIVRDVIGGALVGGSGVQIVVDDAGDTITFSVTNVPTSAISGLDAALAGKEPTVAAGTTAQYRRGDKTWATLNKGAVGLPNVDNTADADKPVSTQQAQAIAARVANSLLGQPNGVATLGNDGILTQGQRPAGSGGTDARFSTPQAFTIGDGVTTGPYNLTHNGNSRASFVSVRQKKAPFKEIRLIDVAHPSLSALQIISDKALPVCEVDVVLVLGTTDATMPTTSTTTLVSKTDTQVVLSASATDNVAVDYYNYFRGGSYIGSAAAGQNYTDTGRTPNTPYSYTSTAVDTSGNESAAQSATLSVTTNVSTTPPVYDGSAFNSGNGNLSVNYTVPAGANRTVYAMVSHINSGATGSSASVTIGGTAATLVGYQGGSGQAWAGVYKRDNVPPGTVAVVLTTGENYSSILPFSYVPVSATTALAGAGGGGTSMASPSTAVAGSELLVSCFSIRESPTVVSGTLRASGNHASGFQFLRVLEGAGASPQQNSMSTTVANTAYAVVSFKIAA